MLSIILIACVLVAVTVAVHVVGVAVLLMTLKRWHALSPTRVWPMSRLLIGMAGWLILCHVAEILVWGLFYLWSGCLPDAEAAFYFSGITYTTIGYGDLLLAKPWRVLAPIEGLTGVLMCGLSAGIFFALVNHLYRLQYSNTTGGSTTEGTDT